MWANETGLMVDCEHSPCCARFPYAQHAEHKKTCPGQTIACPKAGCSWRGEPKDLAAHLQSTESGHGLMPCSAPPKYSARHDDYSTTLVFKTKRRMDDTRRWRPPQSPPRPRARAPVAFDLLASFVLES